MFFHFLETPLSSAAMQNSTKLVLALVNGGALLDYRNREGLTPMHKAAEKGNSEAVKTLLDLGASPSPKDERGLTPLYLAVTHNVDPFIVESLLHDRSTIGAQDSQGWAEVHQVRLFSWVGNNECRTSELSRKNNR